MIENIQRIVLRELECMDTHKLNVHEDRVEVAKAIATVLTEESLEQLAALLGGSLEYSYDGAVVLYTGVDIQKTNSQLGTIKNSIERATENGLSFLEYRGEKRGGVFSIYTTNNQP